MSRSARRSIACAATGALATALACGPPSGGPGEDAAPPGPDAISCYDGGRPAWAEEAGAIEIGTGREAYEPVEDDQTFALIFGIQGGYHFNVRPRIRDLNPGDPEDNQSPDNPHTLLSAYDEDGERRDVHNCGFTRPYEISDGDYHDLGYPRTLRFSQAQGEELDGQRVRIVAEILDAEGRYAQAEVWVTAEVTDAFARPPESPGAGARQ